MDGLIHNLGRFNHTVGDPAEVDLVNLSVEEIITVTRLSFEFRKLIESHINVVIRDHIIVASTYHLPKCAPK